eukprot:jgi/Psemu1/12742/gm1.12742_g
MFSSLSLLRNMLQLWFGYNAWSSIPLMFSSFFSTCPNHDYNVSYVGADPICMGVPTNKPHKVSSQHRLGNLICLFLCDFNLFFVRPLLPLLRRFFDLPPILHTSSAHSRLPLCTLQPDPCSLSPSECLPATTFFSPACESGGVCPTP